MKKAFKVLAVLIGVVIVAVLLLIGYVKVALPRVGAATDIRVEATPERVARGQYLANYVSACMDCHSVRDWTVLAGPYKPGTFGAGGEKFGKEMDFPGTLYSKNLTPAALSGWTDGELFRAITTGESKDGKALFPLMPYHNYGAADPDDIMSIIAYLRTIPGVKNETAARELDFPLNILVNMMPSKAVPQKRPDTANTVAYGGYLVNLAACTECHSRVDKGTIIPGTEFGGGRAFKLASGGVTTSANISPDAETGIGKWNKELFIRKFKQFSDSGYIAKAVKPGEFNTPMPWLVYGRMKERDLAAIFDYLQTVKPVHNAVEYWKP